MAKVSLENVGKTYDGKQNVVDQLNLEIADREFMVLVGPSGCGKSTTLRMIAGLEEISAGTIKIGERVVNDVLPKDRDLAMVFQNYALYPHMTVAQNLAYALKLRKYPRAQIKKMVLEAAEILGLTEMLERKPKSLSGGQRQRVALGRAIVRKPQVFLFDEPLSNLDAKLRVQMRAEISKLHNKLQTTMIYVTHDQVEAMTMGDRICVMNNGLLQQVDTPLNLYDFPKNKFVAGFIGTPPMNFLEGTISQNSQLCFEVGSFKIPVASKYEKILTNYLGKKITLGIRPENIKFAPDSSIAALVEVVEPMGNEVIFYLEMQGQKLLFRTEKRENITVGEALPFTMQPEKMHFFDPETEESLTYDLER
ncbi:MAG: sn-glycerol-3-phosphate ABC transporter ATP-binding protein UgpC [Candidatus Cloacimonadales bacterium]